MLTLLIYITIKNYILVKSVFFVNLKKFEVKIELVSKITRHVILGLYMLKKIKLNKSKKIKKKCFLNNKSAFRPRLGLAQLD